MKFEVNKDVFSEAVSFAVKLLPQRTTLPILSGVLITADGSSVTISSFDYEVSAKTKVAASLKNRGRFWYPAGCFLRSRRGCQKTMWF